MISRWIVFAGKVLLSIAGMCCVVALMLITAGSTLTRREAESVKLAVMRADARHLAGQCHSLEEVRRHLRMRGGKGAAHSGRVQFAVHPELLELAAGTRLDSWGSPIQFDLVENEDRTIPVKIRSYGPDRVPHSADDVVGDGVVDLAGAK